MFYTHILFQGFNLSYYSCYSDVVLGEPYCFKGAQKIEFIIVIIKADHALISV